MTWYFTSLDATAVRLATFGAGTGPIHLDAVSCVGFEDGLVNCSYDSNTADCLHFEDAGVRCRCKFCGRFTSMKGLLFRECIKNGFQFGPPNVEHSLISALHGMQPPPKLTYTI
jgi:hypothetical protein